MLFICPRAEECPLSCQSKHKEPHGLKDSCKWEGFNCPACVPVPSTPAKPEIKIKVCKGVVDNKEHIITVPVPSTPASVLLPPDELLTDKNLKINPYWQRYYKHQLDCDGKQRTWEVDGVIYGHTDSDRYYSQGFNDGAKAQLKKISDKYELQSEAAIRVDQNKKIGDKLAEWRDDWDDEKSWDEMMVLIAKLQKGEDVE